MTFDKLLKEAGEFGFFQKFFVCGFVHISMVVMATAYWTQVYILLVPPHRCKTSYLDNTFSQSASLNYSNITSGDCYANVTREASHNVSGNAACPYGWVYDYSDLYPTFPSEHDWVCDNSWRVYTIHTCYWIGDVVGFILFGSLSDRFGRKKSFMGCVAVMFLGDLASFFTTTFPAFLIARFISAIGEANLQTCCFVLAIEYIGPRYRVIAIAVWSLSFTLASTIMPFIVYAVHDWHHVIAFAWATAALSIIVTSFVPESASWLMTRGRMDDAAKSLHRVAKFNGKRLPISYFKQLLTDGKSKTNSQNQSPINDDVGNDENFQQLSFPQAMVGLFGTPAMRKHTILLTLLWMICAMSYLGNSLETTNLPFSFRINYAVGGIAELPANIICLLTLEKIGRRWANIMFFFVGGILGIIAGGFVTNPAAIIILASIMRMCNAASYDITFTMSSELFPTVVRGRGVSLTRIFGGLASTASPFIFSLSEKNKLLPLEVFGVFCIVGAVLTLFLPETAGEHLPHTLEDGENFGKNQSFFYCPFSRNTKTSSQRSEHPAAYYKANGLSNSFTKKGGEAETSHSESVGRF